MNANAAIVRLAVCESMVVPDDRPLPNPEDVKRVQEMLGGVPAEFVLALDFPEAPHVYEIAEITGLSVDEVVAAVKENVDKGFLVADDYPDLEWGGLDAGSYINCTERQWQDFLATRKVA
jgi:hypothetical protein